MHKPTCIAIDDEPLALNVIKSYVSDLDSIELKHTFDDAIIAEEYLQNNSVDILFIDINMPDIDGITLVKSLTNKPLVIFTTAYKKFAIDGFELDAIDYLLKPITKERFNKAVAKALDLLTLKLTKQNNNNYIFIRSEHKIIKLLYAEIEYIEALGDYVKINILKGKPIFTLMPISKLIDKLPSQIFTRIHRSYIININTIKLFNKRKIILLNGIELPVGDKFNESVCLKIKKQ